MEVAIVLETNRKERKVRKDRHKRVFTNNLRLLYNC